MGSFWRSLFWRCLPNDMKARLFYSYELEENLFVSLPVPTKRTFIRQVQRATGFTTFVETGTLFGEMALFASGLFPAVHTIELSPELAAPAAKRLEVCRNVSVHQGDSGRVLEKVLLGVTTSCVFWLDAHFSGGDTARGRRDTPILEELEAIANHSVRPHAVLIDDARMFGADEDYPSLEEVVRYLRHIDPRSRIGVSSDIIWSCPIRLLRFEWHVAPTGVVVPPNGRPMPDRSLAGMDGR
jgi:hypothetical protein